MASKIFVTIFTIVAIVSLAVAAPNTVNANDDANSTQHGAASSPKGNAVVELAQSGLMGRNASVAWFACPYPCDYLGCNEWTHRYCYCSNVYNCQTCVCLV